jgi:hypothetical protein
MLRKTTGHWMINGNPVSIAEGDICDYPDSATVVEYETEEALIDAHKEANPDLYEEIPVREEEPEGE